jgi:hypothetical protein
MSSLPSPNLIPLLSLPPELLTRQIRSRQSRRSQQPSARSRASMDAERGSAIEELHAVVSPHVEE